jgi:inosine-uridine nucleoside N-ribohydrolase
LGAKRINRIVLMSGVFFDYGNVTNWAEFNAYNDPQALADTLAAGIPVTLVPLDLCRKILLTCDRIDAFAAATVIDGPATVAALREYAKANERQGGIRGCFPHDAIALLVLLRPDQFYLVEGKVSVDVDAKSRGCTRLNTIGGSNVNARVALGGRLRWVRWMIETEWLQEHPSIFSIRLTKAGSPPDSRARLNSASSTVGRRASSHRPVSPLHEAVGERLHEAHQRIFFLL